MKPKVLPISLSVLTVGLLTVGVIHVRNHLLEQEAAKKAAKNVAILQSKWDAAKGIYLTFTEPIDSITWSVNGKTTTNVFPQPVTSAWLKTPLAQGKKSSIEVHRVETVYQQQISETWQLTDTLPQPLQVVTDPGPWQLSVSRSGPYSVTFSSPIENQAKAIKAISFHPKISGTWTWQNSRTAEFLPNRQLLPTIQETLAVTGGKNGPVGSSGQYLPANVNRPFITASNEKIVVSEKLPETLTLYKNGKVIFQSLCNTAVLGGYTPLGNFYIRSKFQHVDMKGVNPNGKPYNDPHVPWVMGLVGNIAIHGFPRAHYGFPQSNGCVELPVSAAKHLYSMVHIGTPVEIVKV